MIGKRKQGYFDAISSSFIRFISYFCSKSFGFFLKTKEMIVPRVSLSKNRRAAKAILGGLYRSSCWAIPSTEYHCPKLPSGCPKTLFQGLYIPCLLAISRHLDQTPYVFMFYIGLVDIACLWINGFFTGTSRSAHRISTRISGEPSLFFFEGLGGKKAVLAKKNTFFL